MMNKLVLFLIISIVILGLILANNNRTIPETNNSPLNNLTTPTLSPKASNAYGYQFNDRTFGVSWFEADPNSLSLIPNYSEKKTSGQVKKANGCKTLVNGGFYKKDGSPIGLVVSNDKVINAFQENPFFNGFFSINRTGLPTISYEVPQNPALAVQSGPVLFSNGQINFVNSNDRESARRVVVAITEDGKLIFISFYLSDSVYEGPVLADLPAHLQKFEELSKIKISDTLNLDGGSASAFVNDGLTLGELTNVGSFFCAK